MSDPVGAHELDEVEVVNRLVTRLAQLLARDDQYGNASGDPDDYAESAREYLDLLGVPELVATVLHPYWEKEAESGYQGFYDKLDKVLHHVTDHIGGEGFGEPGVPRYYEAACWCGWSIRKLCEKDMNAAIADVDADAEAHCREVGGCL